VKNGNGGADLSQTRTRYAGGIVGRSPGDALPKALQKLRKALIRDAGQTAYGSLLL